MTRHEYKGAIIRKRAGLDRLGRAISGYAIQWVGTDFTGYKFSTLREAKAFIDRQVNNQMSAVQNNISNKGANNG